MQTELSDTYLLYDSNSWKLLSHFLVPDKDYITNQSVEALFCILYDNEFYMIIPENVWPRHM